jgi:hypothetical protein
LRRLCAAVPAGALLLGGCLDHELAPGAGGDSFVAMQTDFVGFQGWGSTAFSGAATSSDGHPAGDRVVYLNAEPAEDAGEFAVGTVIVKTIATPAQEGDEGVDIHAMVKRGEGYNVDGAPGWEWFELALDDEARPVIVWRGDVPPDGEGYGALGETDTALEGDCNGCHEAARSNDFVHSIPLSGS